VNVDVSCGMVRGGAGLARPNHQSAPIHGPFDRPALRNIKETGLRHPYQQSLGRSPIFRLRRH
jgi:hypothetical protein